MRKLAIVILVVELWEFFLCVPELSNKKGIP